LCMQLSLHYSVFLQSNHSEGVAFEATVNDTGMPGPVEGMTKNPTRLITAWGFFIRHAFPPGGPPVLPPAGDKPRRFEVLHVALPTETGASWFWLAPGTGVFIDLDTIAPYGAIVEVDTRDDFIAAYGIEWDEYNPDVAMDAAGVSALIIRSGSKKRKTLVPELIVRIKSVTDEQRGTACALPDEYLSAGYETPEPCFCDNSAIVGLMNCGPGTAAAATVPVTLDDYIATLGR